MDKTQVSHEIIAQALPLVPFEGWSQKTLGQAALNAGYKKTDAIRVFPGGAIDAVEFFLHMIDSEMTEALAAYNLDTMKIRERIATIIRIRLELCEPKREALRKALALLRLPLYIHRSLASLYRTVDCMWHLAGDTSTDYNFYTKRLLLAGVYSSTLLFWLNDQSPAHAATQDFLQRRIDNVMQIEKAKHRLKSWWVSKNLA